MCSRCKQGFPGTRATSDRAFRLFCRRHDRFERAYTLLGAPPSCFPRCLQTYPIAIPGHQAAIALESTSPGRTVKVLPAEEVRVQFFGDRPGKQPRPLLPDWLPRTRKRSGVSGGQDLRRDRTTIRSPSWTSHKQSAISVIFDLVPSSATPATLQTSRPD